MKSDANYVGLIPPVDFFGLFIDVRYVPIGRNPRGQIRHGNLLEIKEPGPSRSTNFIRGCSNQEEFRHGIRGSPGRCRGIKLLVKFSLWQVTHRLKSFR